MGAGRWPHKPASSARSTTSSRRCPWRRPGRVVSHGGVGALLCVTSKGYPSRERKSSRVRRGDTTFSCGRRTVPWSRLDADRCLAVGTRRSRFVQNDAAHVGFRPGVYGRGGSAHNGVRSMYQIVSGALGVLYHWSSCAVLSHAQVRVVGGEVRLHGLLAPRRAADAAQINHLISKGERTEVGTAHERTPLHVACPSWPPRSHAGLVAAGADPERSRERPVRHLVTIAAVANDVRHSRSPCAWVEAPRTSPAATTAPRADRRRNTWVSGGCTNAHPRGAPLGSCQQSGLDRAHRVHRARDAARVTSKRCGALVGGRSEREPGRSHRPDAARLARARGYGAMAAILQAAGGGDWEPEGISPVPWTRAPRPADGCRAAPDGVSARTDGSIAVGERYRIRAFIQSLVLWKSATALPGWTRASKSGRSASSSRRSRTSRPSARCGQGPGPENGRRHARLLLHPEEGELRRGDAAFGGHRGDSLRHSTRGDSGGGQTSRPSGPRGNPSGGRLRLRNGRPGYRPPTGDQEGSRGRTSCTGGSARSRCGGRAGCTAAAR